MNDQTHTLTHTHSYTLEYAYWINHLIRARCAVLPECFQIYPLAVRNTVYCQRWALPYRDCDVCIERASHCVWLFNSQTFHHLLPRTYADILKLMSVQKIVSLSFYLQAVYTAGALVIVKTAFFFFRAEFLTLLGSFVAVWQRNPIKHLVQPACHFKLNTAAAIKCWISTSILAPKVYDVARDFFYYSYF